MLPQLDFSYYTSQIFWLLVCLCILIVAVKNRFIPKMNAIIKRREEAISSGTMKLETLDDEKQKLEQNIAETNMKIALNSANILNDVDVKYRKLLSEQLSNLKSNHEEVMKQLRAKYTEDIKAMAEIDADKINMLAEFALQKLVFDGKQI